MRVRVESESRQVIFYEVVCDEHGVIHRGNDYHTAHDWRYAHDAAAHAHDKAAVKQEDQ